MCAPVSAQNAEEENPIVACAAYLRQASERQRDFNPFFLSLFVCFVSWCKTKKPFF